MQKEAEGSERCVQKSYKNLRNSSTNVRTHRAIGRKPLQIPTTGIKEQDGPTGPIALVKDMEDTVINDVGHLGLREALRKCHIPRAGRAGAGIRTVRLGTERRPFDPPVLAQLLSCRGGIVTLPLEVGSAVAVPGFLGGGHRNGGRRTPPHGQKVVGLVHRREGGNLLIQPEEGRADVPEVTSRLDGR